MLTEHGELTPNGKFQVHSLIVKEHKKLNRTKIRKGKSWYLSVIAWAFQRDNLGMMPSHNLYRQLLRIHGGEIQ